jgi:hypothetical protein
MPSIKSNKRRLALASCILLGVLVLVTSGAVFAQRNGWYDDEYEANLTRDIFPTGAFTFCRVKYTSARGSGYGRWRGGGRWQTDYPASDTNFSLRLSELTTIDVNRDENGKPEHAIVELTSDELFNYPFIYMLEVANLSFSSEEQERLRSYLLRGGFLMLDDFWGDYAWENWVYEISQVLPESEYPIVDIPLSHPIFHIVFDISEIPQVPAVNQYEYWQQTGISYEERYATTDPRPHCRGIFDKKGRLMVVMMHNTDLGDGWEREGENEGYFRDFSVKRAYPMGINIVVYAMTH